MEKFIVGLFSEQLETYIEGFHKEQVNANLLNGKGEIIDVQAKVKPINDVLKTFTNLIELQSLFISKLSFNVTSLRNIKKAPIEIYIDEVHLVLIEPLENELPPETMWPTLAKQIVEKSKRKGNYGLIERIQDNIHVEINRIYITFQPMGNLKTRQFGKWTPPAISIALSNFKYVSVDEYGEEAKPDQIWRHNTHKAKQEKMSYIQSRGNVQPNDRRFRHRTLMIYKKFTTELSIAIGYRSQDMSARDSFMTGTRFISQVQMQAHICLHRGIKNNQILAVQVDASLSNVEIQLDAGVVHVLIHFLLGVQACFKKESFVDPFASNDISIPPKQNLEVNHVVTVNGVDKEDMIPDAYASDDSLSDEEDDVAQKEIWPVLILPAGLIVFEKIALTMAVNQMRIRFNYPDVKHEYLQINMNGFVAEVIAPKNGSRDLGACLQTSLAYINIHEKRGDVTTHIMHGGHRNDKEYDPSEETTPEEMFPFFEKTNVRSDPEDFRSTFPIQAFGMKLLLGVKGKEKLLSSSSMFTISNEVGFNNLDIVANIDVCTRVFKAMQVCIGDIEPRWLNCDWQSEASTVDISNAIHRPTSSLLSKFSLQNSDITVITYDTCLHIPISSPKSIKDGGYDINFSELQFVLSPSLPRMFLTDELRRGMNEQNDDKYSEVKLTQIARMKIALSDTSITYCPYVPIFEKIEVMKLDKLFQGISFETSKEIVNGAMHHVFVTNLVQNIQLNLEPGLVTCGLSRLQTFLDFEPQSLFQSSHELSGLIKETIGSCNVVIRFSCDSCDLNLHRYNVESENRHLCSILQSNTRSVDVGAHFFPNKKISAEPYILAKGTVRSMKGIIPTIHNNNMNEIFRLGGESEDDSHHCLGFRFEKGLTPGAVLTQVVADSGEVRFSVVLEKALEELIEAIMQEDWRYLMPKINLSSVLLDNNDVLWLQILSKIVLKESRSIQFVHFDILATQMNLILHHHIQFQEAIKYTCEALKIHSGYSRNGSAPDTYQKLWEKCVQDQSPGFHHTLAVTQKISLQCDGTDVETILPTSRSKIYLHPNSLEGGMEGCFLKLKNIQILPRWQGTFTHIKGKGETILMFVNGALGQKPTEDASKNHESPSTLLLTHSEKELSKVSTILKTTRQTLAEQAKTKRENISSNSSSDDEIQSLQKMLFISEIERLSALSLVNHDMSGILRINASSFTGQRFTSSTAFWSYFVVLRDHHLIAFQDSNRVTPRMMINLNGAVLKSVKGGGAKHIFSRAFSIVELNGKRTFFIAPSSSDYEKWISLLKQVTPKELHEVAQRSRLNTAESSDIPQRSRLSTAESGGAIEQLNSNEDLLSLDVTFDDDISEIDQSMNQDTMSASESMHGLEQTHTLSEDYVEPEEGSQIQPQEGSQNLFKRGNKFRDRMNMMKSTLKNNVKNMNENVKNMKIEKKTFARKTSSIEIPTDTEHLRIKNLATFDMEPTKKESISKEDSSLTSIPGVWNFEVVVIQRESLEGNVQEKDTSLPLDLQFEIHFTRQTMYNKESSLEKIVVKPLSDIMVLFTTVTTLSFSIQNSTEISLLEKQSIAKLMSQASSSGLILKAFLDFSKARHESEESNDLDIDLIASSVSSFLEALTFSPLPRKVLHAIAAFLNLSTDILELADVEVEKVSTNNKEDTREDIAQITLERDLHKCEQAIVRSENLVSRLMKISSIPSCSETSTSDHLKSNGTFNQMRESNKVLLNALSSALSQRDDSHSILVSSSVLHTHEMDMHLKRIDNLESKLKYIEESNDKNSAPAAAFFLGQETIPDINSLSQIEKRMVQNVEVELLELCKQLSNAISMRVATELEIARISEISKIEQEAHEQEKSQLERELLQIKQQLEDEKKKRLEAEKDAKKWRDSFQTMIEDEFTSPK